MPASKCHLEGKDKSFRRVQLLALSRLPPAAVYKLHNEFLLVHTLCRRFQAVPCSTVLLTQNPGSKIHANLIRGIFNGNVTNLEAKEKTSLQKLIVPLLFFAQTWINQVYSLFIWSKLMG